MMALELHSWLTGLVFGSAAATVVTLQFISAPYGRHGRPGWGPVVGPKLGWILMESPAVVAFGGFFALGQRRAELVPLLMLGIWQWHYLYRALIFPFRMRSNKEIPLSVSLAGFSYNLLNAFVNARWISEFGGYSGNWITDPRFIFGLLLFGAGWGINQHSDHVLLHLRKPGESGYVIPSGGMYRYLSCPNYFGELLEWLGWACLTWSWAGLSFFVFTAANLVPRAITHHRWYRETFADYPAARCAILPGIL